METKGKISILTPAYNAAKTIARCVESIQHQTYTDWELLIVDDDSKDDTLSICRQLALEDDRIKVFHVENGGVSKARNFVLARATGAYMTCVDSDDWVEPNMLEILLSYMQGDIQMVCANFYYEKRGKTGIGYISKSPVYKSEIDAYPLCVLIPDSLTYFNGITLPIDIAGAACGKLYKMDVIRRYNIQYPEKVALREDAFLNIQCFIHSVNMVIVNSPLYHYVIDNSSSNFRFRPDVHIQNQAFYDCYSQILPMLKDEYREIFMNCVSYSAYYSLINNFIGHKMHQLGFAGRIKLLNSYLNKYPIYHLTKTDNRFLPLYKRFEMFCLGHRWGFMLLLIQLFRHYIKR